MAFVHQKPLQTVMCVRLDVWIERKWSKDGGGDKKRLMTNKAICNRSLHSDFPSLGKIKVTDINQDRKSPRIHSRIERIRKQKHTEDFIEISEVQDLEWISTCVEI